MYKCQNCGCVFEEPKRYITTHGFTSPPFEDVSGCPACGDGYSAAKQCRVCGEYFLDTDDFTGSLCHDCARAMYTDELGLAFIAERRALNIYEYANDGETRKLAEVREYDFKEEFVERFYNIELDDVAKESGKSIVVSLLLRSFVSLVALEIVLNFRAARDKLKAFCLEDVDYWIDFIDGREKKNERAES